MESSVHTHVRVYVCVFVCAHTHGHVREKRIAKVFFQYRRGRCEEMEILG